MTHPSLVGLLAAVRSLVRRRAGATLGLATLALAASVLVVAWWAAGPDGWVPGTPLPLLLLLVAVLGPLVLALLVLRRVGRWTSEAGLSSELERAARLPEGSVRAQAELLRSVPPGVSGQLARAGETILLRKVRGTPDTLAGEPGRVLRRWLRVTGAGAAVAVTAAALLLVLAPDRSGRAWAGLVHPVALLRPAPLAPLELRPGDATLPRGSSPEIEVLALGRDSVTLHWRAVGAVATSRVVAVDGDGRGVAHLPPLQGELRYRATSPDGAETAEYRLVPEDPSLLVDLVIEARYPPHTRIPDELFRGVPPELVLPAGTRLLVSGAVEGSGEEILLRDEGTGEIAATLGVEEGRFSGSWIPSGSGRLEWVVEAGREGAIPPPPLELTIVPDLPPFLELPVPASDGDLPLSLRVPVLVEVTDDYGVRWVEIETSLRDRSGVEHPPVRDRVDTGDRPTVTMRSTLDFREWDLRPGEEVRLRARAADNAPSQQMAQSATITLRMPLESELRDLVRQRVEDTSARTEELVDRSERELAELRTMERQARLEEARGPRSDDAEDRFQEREELRQALERQAEFADEVDELRAQLEEAREALPEEEEIDRGLADRIEELERLLDELLGPGGREHLEELLDMLRQGEVPEGAGELLREAVERQEAMQGRLEQAMERLRRSVLEESFRSAEEELRSLVDEQTELREQLSEGEGTEAQEDLARRTEALEERLEQLEERLRDGGDQEAADRTAEASSEAGEARQAMEEAADEARDGNTEEAGDRAEEAADALQQALETLEQARADWTDEFEEDMQDELRRGAQSALALARRQGELRRDLQNAGPIRRGELEGDQTAMIEGLRNLAGDFAAATRQNPALGTEIASAIGSAMDAVVRTVNALRANASFQPATDTSAGEVQRALQAVALLALSGLEDEGQSDAPAAAGASAEQILAELEELAQGQESLNRDARALGEDPGADGITSRIEELAQTQEAIASALGELSREPGAGEIPGSLESLAEEAEEIAEELSGGRLDATTLDRQDQLLERLLAAGRTLERDGPTEEREGTPPGAFERTTVSPLPEYLLEVLALPPPGPEELEGLPPGQRRMVLEYFDRVNRRQAGGGDP